VQHQGVDQVLYFDGRPGLDEVGMTSQRRRFPGVAAVGLYMHDPFTDGIPGFVTGDGYEYCRLIPAHPPETVLRGLREADAEDVLDGIVVDRGVGYEGEAAFDLTADLKSAEKDRCWPVVDHKDGRSAVHADIEFLSGGEAAGHGDKTFYFFSDELTTVETGEAVGRAA
jgi:hypothetical protein